MTEDKSEEKTREGGIVLLCGGCGNGGGFRGTELSVGFVVGLRSIWTNHILYDFIFQTMTTLNVMWMKFNL